MTLLKCPKCGCNHIWKNSICSSCGFNTRTYLEQLIKETENMDDDTQREYISNTILYKENHDQMISDILMNMDLILRKTFRLSLRRSELRLKMKRVLQ